MSPSEDRPPRPEETRPEMTGPDPTGTPPPYEPPAIVLERRIEAVANTCAFDPPLTKSNAFEGCTGVTFS